MHDPEICAEVVERLLHIKVNRIDYPELEKTIAPYYSSKGIRLDVYIKNSRKVIFFLFVKMTLSKIQMKNITGFPVTHFKIRARKTARLI